MRFGFGFKDFVLRVEVVVEVLGLRVKGIQFWVQGRHSAVTEKRGDPNRLLRHGSNCAHAIFGTLIPFLLVRYHTGKRLTPNGVLWGLPDSG